MEPHAQDGPLVSVVIPTKDRRSLLVETLASVRQQNYSRWEAVVVDDCSSDDTWPVLLDLAAGDSRIRPLSRNGAEGGAQICRRQGLAAARGSFVLFLDSDDLIVPTALDRRVRVALAHPEADAVVFQAEDFAASPGEYAKEVEYQRRFFEGVDPLDAFLASCAPWCTSGPLWRRGALETVGHFNPEIPILQDHEFHIRALLSGLRFHRVQEVDQYVRQHGDRRVSGGKIARSVEQRLPLLDSVLAMLKARSMLHSRQQRLLAWSALFASLTCAFQRPRPALKDSLFLWRAAADRKLAGAPAHFAGLALILFQWLNVLGPIPRELVRLAVCCDLKKQDWRRISLVPAVTFHAKWMFQLYRNRLQLRRAVRAFGAS